MTSIIPAGRFAGYIFDCDGTFADTMPPHYRAWKRLVEELGGTFLEQLFHPAAEAAVMQRVFVPPDDRGTSDTSPTRVTSSL